jgi:long-chain acyl-CoA synthetase
LALRLGSRSVCDRRAFGGGWLHTGDLARIDDDGLMDRMKDIINRGSENVYRVQVENALTGHGGLRGGGVGVPDETVGAVIVPAPGATFDVTAVLN